MLLLGGWPPGENILIFPAGSIGLELYASYFAAEKKLCKKAPKCPTWNRMLVSCHSCLILDPLPTSGEPSEEPCGLFHFKKCISSDAFCATMIYFKSRPCKKINIYKSGHTSCTVYTGRALLEAMRQWLQTLRVVVSACCGGLSGHLVAREKYEGSQKCQEVEYLDHKIWADEICDWGRSYGLDMVDMRRFPNILYNSQK